MRDESATAIARLEEGLENMRAQVRDLNDEIRYLRRGIVNRLVWAIVVLALALGGKDVMQAALG